MSEVLAAWRDRVQRAAAVGTPVRLVGGGTKDFYGQELAGERFETGAYAGIVDHDPTELVITACCGTPLADVERTLSGAGQMLGFEPPQFGLAATLGGCIAAGLSGPRRPYAGAVRDFVLGVRMLDGRGEDLTFGGRVMKNVAGFDVSRLIAGSLGTLGIILEVSLKCSPLPKTGVTRVLELTADQAIQRMNEWGGQPLPLTATCYREGRLYARLAGAESAVLAASRQVGGSALPDAGTFWSSLREQQHEFFTAGERNAPLWRLSVRATTPYTDLGGAQLIEWGGALRWLKPNAPADPARLRAWARQHGGHATLFRGDKSAGAFQRLDEPLLAIHRALKATFDPAGIFNRRRMFADL